MIKAPPSFLQLDGRILNFDEMAVLNAYGSVHIHLLRDKPIMRSAANLTLKQSWWWRYPDNVTFSIFSISTCDFLEEEYLAFIARKILA